MRHAHRLPIAALLLFVACENPAGSEGGSTPARIDVLSGDLQPNTVVGSEIAPLVVRVVNGDGQPLKGQLVNFRVTSGGGSVFAGSAQTNEDGEARERWTLGTVAGDTQRVEARAVDQKTGQAQLFAVFRAVGTPDAPAAVRPLGTQRAGAVGAALADSLAARVEDRYGNAVPNATVNWSVKRGGGSISPAQSLSDAGGIARSQWVLGPRADSTQIAGVALSAAVQAEFTAVASITGAVTVSAVSGGGQRVTVMSSPAEPLKIVVRTADGRPVAGAPVRWTGAGLTSAVVDTVTGSSGEATARVSLGREARAYLVKAQVGTGPSAEFTIFGTPDAPSSLAPWYSGTLGGAVSSLLDDSIGVVVRDQYGNVVPGVTVGWTAATGGGSLAPASSLSDVKGLAWTRWTLGATAGQQRARATLQGGATAIEIAVNAGTELRIVAGDQFLSLDGTLLEQPRVALYGPNGPIEEARVEWTVASGGGAVSPAASRTSQGNPGGSAATTWTLGGTSGVHQLSARVGSLRAAIAAHRPAGGSLQLLGTPGGRIVDTDGARALTLDSAGTTYTMRIRRLSGGGDTLVVSGSSPRPVGGLLFEGGVLYVLESEPGVRTLHEWRDGSVSHLGPVRDLLTKGSWATWTRAFESTSTQLLRRNLSTGQMDSMADSRFNSLLDLTETGTVLFVRNSAGAGYQAWTTSQEYGVAIGYAKVDLDGDTVYAAVGTSPVTRFGFFSRVLPGDVQATFYRGGEGRIPEFAAENGRLAVREEGGGRGAEFLRLTRAGEVTRLGRLPDRGYFYTAANNAISESGTAVFRFLEGSQWWVYVAPVAGREPYLVRVPSEARLLSRNGRVLVVTANSVHGVE